MDWSRAKSLLIIAFLLTNLYLLFNIYDNNYRHLTADNQEINEVIDVLENKGIELIPDIPRDVSVPGILTVEYQEISPQHLASIFFGVSDIEPIIQNGTTIYMKDEKKLEIKNNREIIYLDLALKDDQKGTLTAKDAVKTGNSFLKTTGLYTPAMVVDEIVPTSKGYSISYVQEYKDVLLEVSYVQLEVTPKGIYSMNMLWLKPKHMEKGRKKIMPAAQALLKIVSSKEFADNPPSRIDDITLVNYFNWEGAKEGEAFPAWKVQVEGKSYYINALTGQYDK